MDFSLFDRVLDPSFLFTNTTYLWRSFHDRIQVLYSTGSVGGMTFGRHWLLPRDSSTGHAVPSVVSDGV